MFQLLLASCSIGGGTMLLLATLASCQPPDPSRLLQRCYNGTDSTVCFRTVGGDQLKSWLGARNWCNNQQNDGQLSLVGLDYEQVHIDMERFMEERELMPHNVWLAGKLNFGQPWRWVNGETYHGSYTLKESFNQTLAAVVTFSANTKNVATNVVSHQYNLICRLEDVQCDTFRRDGSDNGYADITPLGSSLTKSCYVAFPRGKHYDKSTQKWYTARNICLRHGGDLADQGILNMNLTWMPYPSGDHWIGLRQHQLVWYDKVGNITGDITSTYFEGNTPPDESASPELCLTTKMAGRWVWELKQCGSGSLNEDQMHTVCYRRECLNSSTSWTTSSTYVDPVPHLSLGGMIGLIIGSFIALLLIVVATVLLTYYCLKGKCPPLVHGNRDRPDLAKRRRNISLPELQQQKVVNGNPYHVDGDRGSNDEEAGTNSDGDLGIYDDTPGDRVDSVSEVAIGNDFDDDGQRTYDDTAVPSYGKRPPPPPIPSKSS